MFLGILPYNLQKIGVMDHFNNLHYAQIASAAEFVNVLIRNTESQK